MRRGFSAGGGRYTPSVGLVGIVGGTILAVVAVLLLTLIIVEPSAEEVVQAFRDEGLEVGESQQVARDADRSLLPKTYEEQVSFPMPSSGENAAGRVFAFESR